MPWVSTAGEAYEELLDEHRRNNVSATQQRAEEDACVEIRCTVMWNPLAKLADAQTQLVRFPPCLPIWFVAVTTFVSTARYVNRSAGVTPRAFM